MDTFSQIWLEYQQHLRAHSKQSLVETGGESQKKFQSNVTFKTIRIFSPLGHRKMLVKWRERKNSPCTICELFDLYLIASDSFLFSFFHESRQRIHLIEQMGLSVFISRFVNPNWYTGQDKNANKWNRLNAWGSKVGGEQGWTRKQTFFENSH